MIMDEWQIIKYILDLATAAGTAFVTITGGILAIRGFSAWKREYFGKKAFPSRSRFVR